MKFVGWKLLIFELEELNDLKFIDYDNMHWKLAYDGALLCYNNGGAVMIHQDFKLALDGEMLHSVQIYKYSNAFKEIKPLLMLTEL